MKQLIWVLWFFMGLCTALMIYPNKGFVAKNDLVGIGKGIDWQKQSFVCSGTKMEDSNGNSSFYSSNEIDKLVDKLDRILK